MLDMSRSRAMAAVLAIAAACTLFPAPLSQAQSPSGGGFQGGGERPAQTQRVFFFHGTIAAMTDDTITLDVEGGRREEISRSSSTSYVREISIAPGDLAAGDALRVMGRPGEGRNAVDADVVVVGDFVAAGGGLPPRRPEGRGAPRQGEGAMGGIGDGGGREGPVFGTVVAVSPLEIQDRSGSRISVRVGGATRFIRESAVKATDVRAGMAVRVLAPPGPGSGRPEARKVILEDRQTMQPARGEGRIANDDAGRAAPRPTDSSLQPDLPLQAPAPDFFYGVWIGRGLFSNEELDRAFGLASNLGARFVKVEIKWDYVQRGRNHFRWNEGGALDVDHVIALARRYGMSIIPYFDVNMPWAEIRNVSPDQGTCEGIPSRRGQYQAPDPQSYAEYVFAAVDRLKKGGVDVPFIELDNETSINSDGYTSFNCFHNISARQLKEAQNAAYDRIKRVYPGVMVSSTTFLFPEMTFWTGRNNVERNIKLQNRFIEAYFGEAPKPKFDFLGLHERFGRVNPYTTWEMPSDFRARYNLGSYHDAYTVWREILDSHGYRNVPMINLESQASLDGLQDAEMIERVVFARANASRNRVRGWVLGYLTPTRIFSEFQMKGMRKGIANLTSGDDYDLREGYTGFYAIMKILSRYPLYRGKVVGTLNSRTPWVESFGDEKGRVLHVAFIPFQEGKPSSSESETISLDVGPNVEVRMTRSDLSVSTMKSGPDGRIRVEATLHPVFVEVLK